VFENHAAVEQYLLQAEVVVPNPWNNFACDQKKENTRRSRLTYLSNPHGQRCFILLADKEGLYTLSKLNANLRIVCHLKPIWKKIFF
jgi:hypothetical protein